MKFYKRPTKLTALSAAAPIPHRLTEKERLKAVSFTKTIKSKIKNHHWETSEPEGMDLYFFLIFLV